MIALILASGLGNRLKPLTDNVPKALVGVHGKPLLQSTMDAIIGSGVNDFVITTGYLGEKIVKFVSEKYSQIKVNYVNNPDYAFTNAIYSMWLARDLLINNDVLYLHSDLLFDQVLITKLLASEESSCLVNKNTTSVKDFNARIVNNRVKEIGVHIENGLTRFCLPIYKINKNDFRLWMAAIDRHIINGTKNCYAEIALNEVLDRFKLRPVYFNEEIGMEIDDHDDLNLAMQKTNVI